MESSTKQYSTSFVVYPEIDLLKAAPCPDFLRQLSRGMMKISHMDGAALFPWTRPCVCVGGGGVSGTKQVYPP